MNGPRLRRCLGFVALVWAALGGEARAGVEDWEVSELHRGSDPQIRFVELVNLAGGCLFPSSRIDLFDGQGNLLDAVGLTVGTACHAAPTYLLLATSEAASAFGVSRDGNLNSELPSSGQLCFRSSATYYDCVRWGQVSAPVVDLFGAGDTSAASSPSLDLSLARVQTTHVVVNDWSEAAPTPRQPNDGATWEPPDAGVPPDAAPLIDAGPAADARRRTDAAASESLDAGSNRYLDLDTVGGASCGCQSGPGEGAGGMALILLGLWRLRRRSEFPRLLQVDEEGQRFGQ